MGETFGWMNKILRVNLTRMKTEEEAYTESLKRHFLGGRGVNSRILFDESEPRASPLAPESRLIIGTGPLTGTLGSTGRFTVTAKSPLTGIHCDGNSGGHFGPELKYSGFDHIVIYGRSREPVLLWIDDSEVEIRAASNLWGKTVWETDQIIRADLGDDVKTLLIGPAGENLVKFACPINDLSRAPGRGGLGAVMGSKLLKGVAVRGSKSIKIAYPEDYFNYIQSLFDRIYESPQYKTKSELGTRALVSIKQATGSISVRNFQDNYWQDSKAEQVSAETFLKEYQVSKKACFGCPIHCGNTWVVPDGQYKGMRGYDLEWSTISCAGSNYDNSSLASILKIQNLCSEYGIDTISGPNVINFATELWQRGIITSADTGGIKLEWGDYQVMIDLIEKIAYREGFGAILAEGIPHLAGKYGVKAEKCAYVVKNLDDVTDCRSDLGRALNFAVSTRGADHLRGLPTDTTLMAEAESRMARKTYGVEIANKVIAAERLLTAADILGVCKLSTAWSGFDIGLREMAKLTSLVTGQETSESALIDASDRAYHVEKCFNAREGLGIEGDMLPLRAFEPVPSGPKKGSRIDKEKFKLLLEIYYDRRGWDKTTGYPKEISLKQLDISDLINK